MDTFLMYGIRFYYKFILLIFIFKTVFLNINIEYSWNMRNKSSRTE